MRSLVVDEVVPLGGRRHGLSLEMGGAEPCNFVYLGTLEGRGKG